MLTKFAWDCCKIGAILFSQKHFSSFNSLRIKQHAFFLSSSSSAKSRSAPHPIPTDAYKTFSLVQKPVFWYENVSVCRRLLLLVSVALTRFKKHKPTVVTSARNATLACRTMSENASSVFSLSDGKYKSAQREQVSIFFRGNPAVFVSSNYFFFFSPRSALFVFFSLVALFCYAQTQITFRLYYPELAVQLLYALFSSLDSFGQILHLRLDRLRFFGVFW